MKKRLFTFLLLISFANFICFADQLVMENAPEYVSDASFEPTSESTTVVAEADVIELTIQLYYENFPLQDESTITQDNNNQNLLLSESWVLTPFSIILDGTDTEDYALNVDIQVGFFQLLDDNGNIAQGDDGYIIDTQSLILSDITNDDSITFENSPIGSNFYSYNIPITNDNYYLEDSIASFNLSWTEKDIAQPGNYLSSIQLTFSTN
ncbi:MAG: hypothetical protein ACPKM0_06095 [Pleomorphochaeta sp.]